MDESKYMKMRDKFAMAALSGIMATQHKDESIDDFHWRLAQQAYALADAMMEEREKETQEK